MSISIFKIEKQIEKFIHQPVNFLGPLASGCSLLISKEIDEQIRMLMEAILTVRFSTNRKI